MARTKKADKHAVEILERQYQALDLRRRGLSYRAIGLKLGVSHVQIRTDVERVLRQLADENKDKADEIRQLELERLDAVYESLDSWVSSGNPAAANAYLKAMERRAKLQGLDAPVHVILDVDPRLLRDLKKSADLAGVDLSTIFEAMINEFANVDRTGNSEE